VWSSRCAYLGTDHRGQRGSGVDDDAKHDVVMMDDFIYGEPQLSNWRRRRAQARRSRFGDWCRTTTSLTIWRATLWVRRLGAGSAQPTTGDLKMRSKSLPRAAVCVVAVFSLSAAVAFAGEVTGSGKKEDQNRGVSWCSFSGQNDDPLRR
jgi:hypothetical protein